MAAAWFPLTLFALAVSYPAIADFKLLIVASLLRVPDAISFQVDAAK
jgi:hypothetical protein